MRFSAEFLIALTFFRIPKSSFRAILPLALAKTCFLILEVSLRTPSLLALTVASSFTPEAGKRIARSKNLFVALASTDWIVNPVIEVFVARAFSEAFASAGISVVECCRVLSASVAFTLVLINCESHTSWSLLIKV